MVSSVLQSIPQMANVAALLFFVIAMFALIGNQLFMGLFANRCFSTITGAEFDSLELQFFVLFYFIYLLHCFADLSIFAHC
jgi:hypothetical protein